MRLTNRQRQVVEMCAGGKIQKEIAAELGVTINAVWLVLSTARKNNGARTTAELISLYSSHLSKTTY